MNHGLCVWSIPLFTSWRLHRAKLYARSLLSPIFGLLSVWSHNDLWFTFAMVKSRMLKSLKYRITLGVHHHQVLLGSSSTQKYFQDFCWFLDKIEHEKIFQLEYLCSHQCAHHYFQYRLNITMEIHDITDNEMKFTIEFCYWNWYCSFIVKQ